MPNKMTLFMRAHWASLLIALLLNGLVLTNTILHYPKVGYDVLQHMSYIHVLPERLPNDQDTNEFFSAPLPYLIPSFMDELCNGAGWADCQVVTGKFAQVLNFLLSLGITFLLWKLADLLKPGSETLKVSLLAMLGILTVYYRTFSQVRGEPYVAFFVVLTLYLFLKLLQNLERPRWRDGAFFGIVLGLLILSRQWGFFIFPAFGLPVLVIFFKNRPVGFKFGRLLLFAGLVAFIVGGWFYIRLYSKYGSFTAFNLKSGGFSFSNQPDSFYRNLYLERLEIFKEPVRPNYDNTLLPIFYSDTWGDYWGFFTYIFRDNVFNVLPVKANAAEMAPYLGRVNLVSVFPTLILLAGMAWGGWELIRSIRKKTPDPQALFLGYIFAAIVFSGIGYLWFLISYPNPPTGNTNKATYMIQVFVMLPILAAAALEKIREWKVTVYRAILALLGLVFLHNLPAMITRFVN